MCTKMMPECYWFGIPKLVVWNSSIKLQAHEKTFFEENPSISFVLIRSRLCRTFFKISGRQDILTLGDFVTQKYYSSQ